MDWHEAGLLHVLPVHSATTLNQTKDYYGTNRYK